MGCERMKLMADVQRTVDVDARIELVISSAEKKYAVINAVRHSRMAEVIGKLNAVIFDSSDLDIVRAEPSVRRRFLDLEIAQTSPRYILALAAYRKSLEQRNRLLKDLRDGRASQEAAASLSAWGVQLATHGAQLILKRRDFLERLGAYASQTHHLLSEKRDELTVMYQPSFELSGLNDAEEIRGRFLQRLAQTECEERARASTLTGPQRDDVAFLVNGKEGRLFASQGQQRTIALSVKLAERRLIEELVGEPPVLLLDDVLSDLDDIRRAHLFDVVAQTGSQTFLSCTSLRSIPASILNNAAIWRVQSGVVSARE
jgi:DNA replication and repair protein RecF